MNTDQTLSSTRSNACYGHAGSKRTTLFVTNGLPEELVSELLGGATPRHLKAGDTLFQIGDLGDGCYWLDKGILKVCLTSPRAEERILAILSSGAIVGDLATIDALPRSASIVAMTDCEICFIRRSIFEQVARQYPDIYRYLAEALGARLLKANETIASLAFLTVKGRVARALVELAENLGNENNSGAILLPPIFRQRELAAMAGVARENVCRTLSDFERRGLITKSGRSFRIENKTKLEGEMDW